MKSKDNPIFYIEKTRRRNKNNEGEIYDSFGNYYPIQVIYIKKHEGELYALTKFMNLITQTINKGYFKTSLFKSAYSQVLIYFYEKHID